MCRSNPYRLNHIQIRIFKSQFCVARFGIVGYLRPRLQSSGRWKNDLRLDKVPLDRLAQQWYGNGIRLSGFSTVFIRREVTKIARVRSAASRNRFGVRRAMMYTQATPRRTAPASCHHLMLIWKCRHTMNPIISFVLLIQLASVEPNLILDRL